MSIWTLLKAISWQVKLGIAIGVLAILAAAIGSSYFIGYNKGVNVAALQIQRYQIASQRIQNDLEKLQSVTNVKYVTQYKDRVSYVDRVVYKTQQVVTEKVPEQFYFSKGWVYAFNQSAQGLEPDPNLSADSSPSSISDLRALRDTLIPNNGRYYKLKSNYDNLVDWTKETHDNSVKASNEKK